jgi:hypothetical protein
VFEPGSQRFQKEGEHVFVCQPFDRNASTERPLLFDGAGAPRSGYASYYMGLSFGYVEGQFDVVVPPFVGGQPEAATGSEHGKCMSFGLQGTLEHAGDWNRRIFEKGGIRPLRLGRSGAALLGAVTCLIHGRKQTLSNK